MSEQGKIKQNIREAEYAATSATGDANIIITNYYYREEARLAPAESSDAVDENLPCPYRGLFHFGPNNAEFFFGREIVIEELYHATKTRNFIPLLGASGSGKSSVVLAGLVPKLEQEGNWKFTHFRPGDEPFHALARALVPLYKPNLDSTERFKQSRLLAKYFSEGSVPLKDVFAQIEIEFPDKRILIIADQFEELFTLCPKEKIQHNFLDFLLASFLSSPSNIQFPPVLVITMRVDFLGNALSYRPLADALNSDIKLGAMNREELLEVIEKPAKYFGVKFESGLVERILDDVKDEPGNLALLEFALTELWKERKSNQLTHKAYENIGKVGGALAEYAEQKYLQLDEKKKQQARQIFIELVSFGEENNDTRRRVNRKLIGEANWKLVTGKSGLADSRLVVTNHDNIDSETVELVHEALISNWERLRQWLDDDRDNLKKQRKIEDAAQEWQSSDHRTDYLLSKQRFYPSSSLIFNTFGNKTCS